MMVPSKHGLIKKNIYSNLICCQNYIRTLKGVTFERNAILEWFTALCEYLTKIIGLIGTYFKENPEKFTVSIQNTLVLYLTQILTSLSFLINIFVKEDELKQVIVEARNCFVKQMICCLEYIEITFNCGNSLINPSDNFVKWMDTALDKLSEVDTQGEIKTTQACEEARIVFEEVLSHAMSIAQVALTEDSKIIRGSCQSVLQVLNSLTKEINNDVVNGAMVNLFVDACSNKLCMLERKINTTVLKLCFKIFCQFTQPLEKIHDFCFNPSNKEKVEELDNLVADFDLHVDRIMQIGLFAVSCSSDFARGIKIRSSLASLEALESELVPALTSVLFDNSVHNTNCAKLLMKHWINQATALQQLIYLIIDPFAFCQIIYEEATEVVNNLSHFVERKNVLKQNDINYFISLMRVLKEFLNTAKTECSETEMNQVKTKLKNFNAVFEEVESASKILLNEQTSDFKNCLRVLKRCKVLITVLKRLWYCFADDIAQKNISAEKHAKTFSSTLENMQIEPTKNPLIDHIINRGKQILQDRSVLYRTPIKPCTSIEMSTGVKLIKSERREVPLSKLVHLRTASFFNVSAKNDTTLDLQITDILDEMTNLSTAFNNV